MYSTYDQWKLASPYDDPLYCKQEEEEPEFFCEACEDVGWLMGPNECAWPCTECSQDVTLEDLEELRS